MLVIRKPSTEQKVGERIVHLKVDKNYLRGHLERRATPAVETRSAKGGAFRISRRYMQKVSLRKLASSSVICYVKLRKCHLPLLGEGFCCFSALVLRLLCFLGRSKLLVATQSRSGSGSHSGFHSIPSRRFATPPPRMVQYFSTFLLKTCTRGVTIYR